MRKRVVLAVFQFEHATVAEQVPELMNVFQFALLLDRFVMR